MAFNSLNTVSIFGRRLGLQIGPITGAGGPGAFGNTRVVEFLVGPDDLRREVNPTQETTGVNLKAHGVSNVLGTSAASSSVYVLDPPVPGVTKTIYTASGQGAIVKTLNSETIVTSAGSSFTTAKASTAVFGSMRLVGVTTAQWLLEANAGAFVFSTTT